MFINRILKGMLKDVNVGRSECEGIKTSRDGQRKRTRKASK